MKKFISEKDKSKLEKKSTEKWDNLKFVERENSPAASEKIRMDEELERKQQLREEKRRLQEIEEQKPKVNFRNLLSREGEMERLKSVIESSIPEEDVVEEIEEMEEEAEDTLPDHMQRYVDTIKDNNGYLKNNIREVDTELEGLVTRAEFTRAVRGLTEASGGGGGGAGGGGGGLGAPAVQEMIDESAQELIDAAPLRFRGGISVDVDTAPASPDNGDVYVNNTSAVANASWSGIVGETIATAQAIAWSDENSQWYAIGSMQIDTDTLKKEAAELGTPVGTMSMWMGATAPDGYLLLQGGSFDITQYPMLNSYLINNFDGYSSGTLPDFRGHFPGGHGDLGMSSDMGGKTSATTGDPGLSIVSNGSHSHTATTTANTSVSISGGSATTSNHAGHQHDTHFHTNKDNNTSNSGNNVNLLTQYHNNGNATTRKTDLAGSHSHTVDLSSVSATGTTTATTTLSNAGSHSHSLSGWDTQTMPNAFAINFMIRHDY